MQFFKYNENEFEVQDLRVGQNEVKIVNLFIVLLTNPLFVRTMVLILYGSSGHVAHGGCETGNSCIFNAIVCIDV